MSINIPITSVSIAFRKYTKENGINAAELVTKLLKECNISTLTGIMPLSYNSKQYGIGLKADGKDTLNILYSKSIYPKHVIVTELIGHYLKEKGVNL